MTKDEAVNQACEFLGDSTAAFIALGRTKFDRVMEELAQNECLGSLRREASFQFTAAISTYNSGTATGLSAGPPQVYPIKIEKLRVPVWSSEAELLKIEDEAVFDSHVSTYGATYQARPRWWRMYPNEQTIEVFPVPRSDDSTASALKILYWAPPATLANSDAITEVRNENLHVLIAGLVWHLFPFQDETLVDKDRALIAWQSGIGAMRAQQRRARYGDLQRIHYREP